MKKIYISGKINGDKSFSDKFARTERLLSRQGHTVLNPARLPEVFPGLKYQQYMRIDLVLIDFCDAIYLMPCWKISPGATREKRFAESLGKEIIYGG